MTKIGGNTVSGVAETELVTRSISRVENTVSAVAETELRGIMCGTENYAGKMTGTLRCDPTS